MSEVLHTVRCEIRDPDSDRVLLLRKDVTSKNPNAWELPGGKIDEATCIDPTPEQLRAAVVREVREETGIVLDPENLVFITSHSYQFFRERRTVHSFATQLPIADIHVNQTMNANGQPEDHHDAYRWFTDAEVTALGLRLATNSLATLREIPPISLAA